MKKAKDSHVRGCWENKFQVQAFKKPRGISTQGKMLSLKPAGAPIFFPLSDLAMKGGGNERKKMGENGSSPLKPLPEEASSSKKSLILWDWKELIFASMR
ncbi:unnamed protein product [Prunus armeniaca]